MALTVVYSNAFGGLFAENRSGTVSNYVPDTLGSSIGLTSAAGSLTDRWEYWPYGEAAVHTGSSLTPFTWIGILGYYLDQVSKVFYVRARHLRVDLARWLTVDQRWPEQPAYTYSNDGPTLVTDPSGQAAILIAGCVVACAGCLICIAGFISSCTYCKTSQCWFECLIAVLQNLPTWAQVLCGATCAGCLACVGALVVASCVFTAAASINVAFPASAPRRNFCLIYACYALASLPCLPLKGWNRINCLEKAFRGCIDRVGSAS